MTREHKLALIVGFALVLVVGVLISDHLSGARHLDLAESAGSDRMTPATHVPGFMEPDTFVLNQEQVPQTRPVETTHFTQERPAHSNVFADGASEALKILREAQDNPPAAQPDTIEMGAPPLQRPRTQVQPTPERPREVNEDRRTMPVHRVQRGESLWSIAERYYADGHLHDELAAYNEGRVGRDGALQPGVRLQIPPSWMLRGELKPATKTPRQTPRQTPSAAASRTYTVQPGDTLGEISMELLGTSKRWQELLDLNGLKDARSLRVGMKLKVPAR
ncbi:MAG: LysM peptidoglycan-binding domain-containing protein [Planctomycetota bacterium]